MHLVGPYYATHTFVHMHTASQSLFEVLNNNLYSNLLSNKHLPTGKEKSKEKKPTKFGGLHF